MHQPNGDHEHRASQKLVDLEDSDDGLSSETCHFGMIRHVNADGEPIIARYVDPDPSARPPVETKSGRAPSFR